MTMTGGNGMRKRTWIIAALAAVVISGSDD
jgi:hypothetical protein